LLKIPERNYDELSTGVNCAPLFLFSLSQGKGEGGRDEKKGKPEQKSVSRDETAECGENPST
jgi:hypothetical protein